MCNFNCKIRLQTFQMFLTKLKQKYKKIELLKNFCKNQIGFLQSQKKLKYTLFMKRNDNINFTMDFFNIQFDTIQTHFELSFYCKCFYHQK